MGHFFTGLNIPEVTHPTFCDTKLLQKSWVFDLIGAFPIGISPTNLYSVPFSISDNILFAPGKLPSCCPPINRDFCMAHLSPAAIGEVLISISWPYKHKPASSLSESRAPKPTSSQARVLAEYWQHFLRPYLELKFQIRPRLYTLILISNILLLRSVL